MKYIFILLITLLPNYLFSLEIDTNRYYITKVIPSIYVKSELNQVLNILVENCEKTDSTVNKFIIYMDTVVGGCKLFAKPIGRPPIYTEKIFGSFFIRSKVFYCVGNLLDSNNFLVPTDSFSEQLFLDSSIVMDSLGLVILSNSLIDLNTEKFKACIEINFVRYNLILQPSSNFSRKEKKVLNFLWK